MLQEKNVGEIVRKMEDDEREGNTIISEYVTFNLRETINRIEAYLNSKHISGEKDSKGREKPFFNIITSAVNIWYRATDIDRKNIRVKATKQNDMMLSYIANIIVKQWMRRINFGAFLNEWGRVLSRYGSAVVEFVEKKGELYCSVIPWSTLIIDPVDFEKNVKIKKLYYTPGELLAKKEYDEEEVRQLIDNQQTREINTGQQKDNKDDFIEVYEIHGLLPLSYLTGEEEDEYEYIQQMHVISYVLDKEETKKVGIPQFNDYSLYMGREKKDPLMITHLIKEDGRSLSIGAVEHLFDAQWMQNHSVKQIKDQLDLASKLIFQTSDGNFVGQNALSDIESGDILTWSSANGGSPLTQLQNNSHDITSSQAFQNTWKSLGMEINGINEAMTQAPKSGTAWRQTQSALQEAHSLFELMTENKGLDIERMMREYILPWVKTKLDTSEELSEILDKHDIEKLDSIFVPKEVIRRVNDMIKKDILSKTPEQLRKGELFTPEMQMQVSTDQQSVIEKALGEMGNQRFIKPSEIDNKTWKEVLKDFEWDVEVDVTGEATDAQVVMDTLSTMLQFFSAKQGVPLTAEERLITNRILEETGVVSAIELDSARQVQEEQMKKQQQAQTLAQTIQPQTQPAQAPTMVSQQA